MTVISIVVWLWCVIPLGTLSVCVFFIVRPMFIKTLFPKKWVYKVLGLIMTVITAVVWIFWLLALKIIIGEM